MPLSAIGGKPAIARAARHSELLPKPRMDRVYALPNAARYQLRYTPIVIKLWSCKWSNLWSNTFLTAIFCFPYRPKIARLKGFRRLAPINVRNAVYAPKPGPIPTSLHPDIHFSAIIPRRRRKSKFFLSAPVPMGKLVFAPHSVASRNPANADAARLPGVSSYPVPDTAAALSSAALSRSVCP